MAEDWSIDEDAIATWRQQGKPAISDPGAGAPARGHDPDAWNRAPWPPAGAQVPSAPASRQEWPAEPPPRVYSAAEALGRGRRYLDALLVTIFATFSLARSGDSAHPTLIVLIGLFALGYAGWIAFSRGSYVMPYWLYAFAVLGLLVFLFH